MKKPETGEAFQLYVCRINHNLTMLLEQLVLLQAIMNAEPESPTEIQDRDDNPGLRAFAGRPPARPSVARGEMSVYTGRTAEH